MLSIILDEQSIQYLIQSDDLGGLNPALSYINGIRLYVSDEDYEKTMNLIPKK